MITEWLFDTVDMIDNDILYSIHSSLLAVSNLFFYLLSSSIHVASDTHLVSIYEIKSTGLKYSYSADCFFFTI